MAGQTVAQWYAANGITPPASTAPLSSGVQGATSAPSAPSGSSVPALGASAHFSSTQQVAPLGDSVKNLLTPQPQQPVDPQLDALKKQVVQLQQQAQTYQNALAGSQQTQYTPPVVAPTPTPNPITSPIATTGVQSATAAPPTDLGVPKGPGGFTFSGVAPGSSALPSVSPDATYNLWRQMNGGKDNPQMQAYFNSPDWQSVAAGNIPMWQSADPIWRSFLTRLGYMSPSFDQNMNSAIQNRLSALQAQQTTPTT